MLPAQKCELKRGVRMSMSGGRFGGLVRGHKTKSRAHSFTHTLTHGGQKKIYKKKVVTSLKVADILVSNLEMLIKWLI